MGGGFREFVDLAWNYIWFFVIAVMGGTANYINKIKKDDELSFSFVELLGEWFISGFAGIITMHVCLDMGWSIHVTAAVTGIAGHMGSRAIYLIEQYFLSKLPDQGSK